MVNENWWKVSPELLVLCASLRCLHPNLLSFKFGNVGLTKLFEISTAKFENTFINNINEL